MTIVGTIDTGFGRGRTPPILANVTIRVDRLDYNLDENQITVYAKVAGAYDAPQPDGTVVSTPYTDRISYTISDPVEFDAIRVDERDVDDELRALCYRVLSRDTRLANTQPG